MAELMPEGFAAQVEAPGGGTATPAATGAAKCEGSVVSPPPFTPLHALPDATTPEAKMCCLGLLQAMGTIGRKVKELMACQKFGDWLATLDASGLERVTNAVKALGVTCESLQQFVVQFQVEWLEGTPTTWLADFSQCVDTLHRMHAAAIPLRREVLARPPMKCARVNGCRRRAMLPPIEEEYDDEEDLGEEEEEECSAASRRKANW